MIQIIPYFRLWEYCSATEPQTGPQGGEKCLPQQSVYGQVRYMYIGLLVVEFVWSLELTFDFLVHSK